MSYYDILASAAGLRPALNLVLAGGWLAALAMMLAALAFDIFSSILKLKQTIGVYQQR